MFYMIVAILLALFYLFIAPQTIKGTLNLVALVFLLVALVILIGIGASKLFGAPLDMWVAFGMCLLGVWAVYDIYTLDKSRARQKKRKPYRYR